MGCRSCNFTGMAWEWDDEVGSDVQIPCPECIGVDGDQPDWVTDVHDAATQAEVDEAWRQHDLDKVAHV